MYKKSVKPSAIINNKSLILSLPDALTPVIWVMEMHNNNDFFIKIEQNDTGLFVLQKVEVGSQKIEDIAFYNEREKALRALNVLTQKTITDTLSDDTEKGVLYWIIASLNMMKNIGLIAVALLVLYMISQLSFVKQYIWGQENGQVVESAIPQNQVQDEATDPSAIGVPMSADMFLEKKSTYGLPF